MEMHEPYELKKGLNAYKRVINLLSLNIWCTTSMLCSTGLVFGLLMSDFGISFDKCELVVARCNG